MAKKTLLTASQIQSVEPYIQNVLIEDKSASLLQGSLVQVCETLTQEISGEESKLLLPSIESSTTETQGILISERPSDSLITTFPTDVEIIYVPNITPVLPRTYLAKPVFSEFVVKQPKPCVTCEGPTAWGVTSQSQSPSSTPPPIYTQPNTTPINITIVDSTRSVRWHPTGVIFSENPDDPMSIMYSGGKIFIHDWNVLPIAQIVILGKENYHPERMWYVQGSLYITLGDKEGYYLFAKVPVGAGLINAEIIITKQYMLEDRYDDYICLLLGTINYINDHPVFSMLWGNDTSRLDQISKFIFRDVLSSVAYPSVKIPIIPNNIAGPFYIHALGSIILKTECIHLNGMLQEVGSDYTISGKIITFLSESIPQIGDTVLINYILA